MDEKERGKQGIGKMGKRAGEEQKRERFGARAEEYGATENDESNFTYVVAMKSLSHISKSIKRQKCGAH